MGIAVARNLFLTGLALATLSGCDPSSSDDSSDQDDNSSSQNEALQVTDVDQDNAGQVVVAFFEREGYFSGSYFHQAKVAAEWAVLLTARGEDEGPIPPLPDDYVRAESLTGPNTRVRMSVDDEGNILPNRDWRAENSGYCLEQGKYMRAPFYELHTEFHPETREVFVRVLEIETGEILKAGRGQGDGDTWVDDAMTDAWNQSDIPEVQQADSPCGDEIQLTLVIESEVKSIVDGGAATETTLVESRIPLGTGSQSGHFIGSAPLVSTEYGTTGADSPYADCTWSSVDGNVAAKVEVPDGNFDPDAHENFYENLSVTLRILDVEAPQIRRDCTITVGSGGEQTLQGPSWYPWFHVLNQSDTKPFSYFYPDGEALGFWDPVDDEPQGLAKVTIDQSDSFTDEGETITLEEVTTLTLYTKIMPAL